MLDDGGPVLSHAGQIGQVAGLGEHRDSFFGRCVAGSNLVGRFFGRIDVPAGEKNAVSLRDERGGAVIAQALVASGNQNCGGHRYEKGGKGHAGRGDSLTSSRLRFRYRARDRDDDPRLRKNFSCAACINSLVLNVPTRKCTKR